MDTLLILRGYALSVNYSIPRRVASLWNGVPKGIEKGGAGACFKPPLDEKERAFFSSTGLDAPCLKIQIALIWSSAAGGEIHGFLTVFASVA